MTERPLSLTERLRQSAALRYWDGLLTEDECLGELKRSGLASIAAEKFLLDWTEEARNSNTQEALS